MQTLLLYPWDLSSAPPKNMIPKLISLKAKSCDWIHSSIMVVKSHTKRHNISCLWIPDQNHSVGRGQVSPTRSLWTIWVILRSIVLGTTSDTKTCNRAAIYQNPEYETRTRSIATARVCQNRNTWCHSSMGAYTVNSKQNYLLVFMSMQYWANLPISFKVC